LKTSVVVWVVLSSVSVGSPVECELFPELTQRSEIPLAGQILNQVNARSLQTQRVDLDLLVQQWQQLNETSTTCAL
jgi:hypothetical protein